MAMVVKNNMAAERTLNVLNDNQSKLQESLAKVSSGMKINSAKDDASGYAISERMRVEIRSLDQANQNTQNAASLLKTAEGAVSQTLEIVKTMKEKAINAANDTNTDDDRVTIQKEIDQLISQVDDNALVTFNGKMLLDGSTSVVEGTSEVDEDARTAIIKGLSSEWVQAALDLVDSSFGLGFNDTNGANAGVREIDVQFEDNETSTNLAYVTNWPSSGSKASKLTLTINMKYYNSLDTTSVDGASSDTSMYLDRTLAHEFTHAAMAANIADFNSLPKWFKEGSAELVHGADDARAVSMVKLLNSPTTLQNVLNGTYDTGDYAYAAGYMILRYMTKETVDAGNAASPVDVVKNLMSELANSSGSSTNFDTAINTATGGIFTDKADLISDFMTVVNNAATDGYNLTDTSVASFDASTGIATFSANGAMAFLKDKFGIDTQYYSSVNGTATNDPDTGAVTGSDARGGTAKDKHDIVPETTTTTDGWTLPTEDSTTYDGLKVVWPDGYTTSITTGGDAYTYDTLTMIDKKIHIQVGSNANQSTNIGFFDMRSKALGLIDTDGNNLSVVTRDKALESMTKLDRIVTRVLNQQTDIGAMLQRLEYTSSNLTTASENLQAAESVIRDADMAKEMTTYTKNNVLLQAAQSMLAQANQNSSAVLSLLQ